MESRTTIYKKTSTNYQLKMKTSRAVFSEISSKFGPMAFNIRNLEDEKKAKMGVIECLNHSLLLPYDVFHEKEGSLFNFSASN